MQFEVKSSFGNCTHAVSLDYRINHDFSLCIKEVQASKGMNKISFAFSQIKKKIFFNIKYHDICIAMSLFAIEA